LNSKLNIEIERKYLLKQFPSFLPKISETHFIFQVFLSEEKRIRRINNGLKIVFEETIKTGQGLSRQEISRTIEAIPDVEFAKLLVQYPSIEKIRYYFVEPFSKDVHYRKMMIDVFQNCKLILYEIEFNDIESAYKFLPPSYIIDYIDREVTNDFAFNNFALAQTIYEKNKTTT